MKIPQSLKIGGHNVEVLRVAKILNGDLIAQVQVATNQIWIANKINGKDYISESMKAEGLLHEIIHYIMIQNGYGVSEKLTTSLAAGLFQVIRDNNLDFRKVKK